MLRHAPRRAWPAANDSRTGDPEGWVAWSRSRERSEGLASLLPVATEQRDICLRCPVTPFQPRRGCVYLGVRI